VPSDPPSAIAVLSALEEVLAGVIEQNRASVVSISRIRPDELSPTQPEAIRLPGQREVHVPNEYGTGVVIDGSGKILTNYHVLGYRRKVRAADPDVRPDEGMQYFVSTSDHRTFSATIVAADPRTDLAVLQIESDGEESLGLAPIRFGDSETLKPGHFVIGLGNPYAIARDGQASATFGIVSNVERKAGPFPVPPEETDLRLARPTIYHYGSLIQTDMRLKLGTSGGPLLNLRGEMVGLTTSLAAVSGYEESAGFAIPVDAAFRRVVETLKAGMEPTFGMLGVLTRSDLDSTGAPSSRGARIDAVSEGLPAWRSNLLPGDVISHVDDRPIHDSDDLMLSLGRLEAGATVILTVRRNGQQLPPVPVELTRLPVPLPPIVTVRGKRWRGIEVDFATSLIGPQNLPLYGDLLREGGVGVRNVDADSPGWAAGLRPGQFVTHAAGSPVRSTEEFFEVVQGLKGDVELRLWDSRQPVVVEADAAP
jgi:serine protease Do